MRDDYYVITAYGTPRLLGSLNGMAQTFELIGSLDYPPVERVIGKIEAAVKNSFLKGRTPNFVFRNPHGVIVATTKRPSKERVG